MKIKTDHVTNSSSASFMIPKSCLTEKQIMMIRDHIETAAYLLKKDPDNANFDYIAKSNEWKIDETKDSIQGSTSMTNFNMFSFLISIGVNESEIHYESDG